jgi:hypothetical protein
MHEIAAQSLRRLGEVSAMANARDDRMRPVSTTLLGLCLMLTWPGAVCAQTTVLPVRTIIIGEFLATAHSSALLQKQAAVLAATDTARSEVKQFAQDMVEFRSAHIQRLEALAAQHRIILADLTAEERLLIDNLKTLDILSLSRRYVELQVQVLEREVKEYQVAVKDIPVMESFIAEFLPLLLGRLGKAREVLDAVSS